MSWDESEVWVAGLVGFATGIDIAAAHRVAGETDVSVGHHDGRATAAWW